MGKRNWKAAKKATMAGHTKARLRELHNGPVRPIKVILYNNLCPGDLLAMTPALAMLHEQYPGQYLTDVVSFHPGILENNPYVTQLDPDDPDAVHLWTTYPLVNQSGQRPIHFIEAYLDWLRQQFDVDLALTTNRPQMFLTPEEKGARSLVEEVGGPPRYWLINAGWKNDYTVKRYPTHLFQEVVDHFRGRITFAQVGHPKDNHPPLDNVVNLIGRTTIRQLLIACYHAQGGLGTVTCVLHMFAGFGKPYVVMHGAREPTHWTNYNTQRTLQTIGTLPCCLDRPCWRSRIVPLGDGDKKDKRCCEMPMVDNDGAAVATCMWNIKPRHVIEAIEGWYEGGRLKYD